MKNIKLLYTPAAFIKMNKIEVFEVLSEKFGSKYGVPPVDAKENQKMNFQLDRLFTVIHDN